MKLIIQTKPFQLTRPNTKPYRGQRGQKSNNFSGIVSFQVVTSEEEDGDERKEREKGGFQLQQEIQVSLKGHFVGLISFPREQLLSIKMKLENLQSEYGCSPNFLLIFEDNVTEKVNLRGRDSLTAGRFLFSSIPSVSYLLRPDYWKCNVNFSGLCVAGTAV